MLPDGVLFRQDRAADSLESAVVAPAKKAAPTGQEGTQSWGKSCPRLSGAGDVDDGFQDLPSLRGRPPVCDRAGSSPASVCQATLLIRGCHTGTPPVSDSSSSIRRRYSDSNSAPCVLLTPPGGGVLVVRGAGSPLNTVREPGQVVAAGPPHALPGHRPGRVPPCIEVRQAVSQVSWIIFCAQCACSELRVFQVVVRRFWC